MSTNRRRFFAHVAVSGAGLLASGKSIAGEGDQPAGSNDAGKAPERERATNVERDPFRTPDLPKLPWKMIDGVKEFQSGCRSGSNRVHAGTRCRRLGL